ncbi:type II toxin-antitoxin system PemK/MazF family toxin [Glaciecola sp. SC05]|uniref:type II toxin-antitoxin system PemK/MazF family toxin n=1 Tax=Glaciecola sp. SC05 TaxID=1987355 RepID=UPI003529D146
MKSNFKRGDIVHLNFDPQSGREMKGKHYALVISNDTFNRSGLAMVCPITQGIHHREGGFTTTLMGTGLDTLGVVVSSQVKTLDLHSRRASLKEHCDRYVVDEVLAKVMAILD